MQRYKIIAVHLCLLILVLLTNAQESKTANLFNIEESRTRFEYVSYPWGEELAVQVVGYAKPILASAVLTITISYEGKRITWANIQLGAPSNRGEILFQWSQSPINTAAQEILAGKYTLTIELNWSNQEQNFSKRLLEILQEAEYEIDYKNPIIHSIVQEQNIKDISQVSTQWEGIQNFYISRIQNINKLFGDFFKNRQMALALKRKNPKNLNNPFEKDGQFSAEKWGQYWLEFNHQLEEEKKLLLNYPKQVVVLIYPTTQNNLIVYCETIEQITQFYNKAVYDTHQIPNNISYVDGPSNMMGLREILRKIRDLHQEMGQEMQVDLVRKVGYLPPPPIFGY